jgi:hypothetical protein
MILYMVYLCYTRIDDDAGEQTDFFPIRCAEGDEWLEAWQSIVDCMHMRKFKTVIIDRIEKVS